MDDQALKDGLVATEFPLVYFKFIFDNGQFVKIYQCGVCEYRGFDQDVVKTHCSSHEGGAQCKMCGENCDSYIALELHMARHRKQQQRNQSSYHYYGSGPRPSTSRPTSTWTPQSDNGERKT